MEPILDWIKETNIQAAVIGPIISSIIGGFAFVVHEKNTRKIALSKLIQETESLAIDHWCSEANDNENRRRANKILYNIKTLGWKIDQKNQNIKDAIIGFRQSITSGDFGETSRQSISFDNTRITLISEKTKNLRKTLNLKKHH